MTLRPRTTRPTSRTTRLRHLFEGEERQQLAVTVLFIAVIAAVILILLGAVALAFYNDNLRPLGRVGSTEIGPQQLRDRVAIEQWRISRDQGRVTQAQINKELDATQAQARLTALDTRLQALQTSGLEDLIDLIYQSQLAPAEGITVADSQVDAQVAKEFTGVERRHVLAIFVKPTAADATAGTTAAERKAALDKAQQALAALNAGTPYADVARQFSTDVSSQNGGDFGVISEQGVVDPAWGTELFKLPLGGTTGVIRGADGVYRIGQVTEITPAGEEPGLRDGLLKNVSEKSLRTEIGYELAADALKEKIIGAALAQTPEQVRLAIITVNGLFTGDPLDAQGEIKYREIVFAPGKDLTTAPNLPADDPAWTQAKADADAAYAELSAITDKTAMATRFAAIATDRSDAPSATDGGLQDFTTRSTPPDAIGVALFDSPHQANDLIGPVRADAAYYVLLFEERRASPEQRMKAVQDALAVPGADFNEVASRLSEGPEKADRGEIGWLTKAQLSSGSLTADQINTIFALGVGGVTDPIDGGQAHFVVKVEEKANRPLDPDQIPDIRSTAFDTWYTDKKNQAETDGVIVRNGANPNASIDPGSGLVP